MDEEIKNVLEDETLDNDARVSKIKEAIGDTYVPREKLNSKVKEESDKYEALKKEYEDFKKSKMTDEEKANAEKIENENKIREANKTISRLYAENIFKGSGLSEDDYKPFIEDISLMDADKAKEFATNIANLISGQKQKTTQDIKNNITAGTPTPNVGEPPKGSSKREEIEQNLINARKDGNRALEVKYLRELQALKD